MPKLENILIQNNGLMDKKIEALEAQLKILEYNLAQLLKKVGMHYEKVQ